jgi:hypothetical protein
MSVPVDIHSGGDEGYQPYNREYLLPTQAEPPAVINAREIEDWCERCEKFKLPILSDETTAGICIGIAAGCATAWWAGDFTKHPDRAFALQLGIAVFMVAFVIFLIRTIHARGEAETDLAMLSRQMERAKKAGLGRARVAIEAESASDRAKPAPQSSG